MQTASKTISRDTYLAREKTSEVKHELYRGEIFAMTGGTFQHAAIAGNCYAELKALFRDKDCTPMNSDMRVHTTAGLDTYPDVSVFCGPPDLTDEQRTLLNPVLIIEVLSHTTSSYDRGNKFRLYRSIGTLKDYLLVDSEQVSAEHFRRTDEDEWVLHVYTDISDSVPLASVHVALTLRSLYAGIQLDGRDSE